MTILIRIPVGLMRFVPAHRQYDDMTTGLSPTKWPVEFVLMSDKANHEAHLD